MIALPSPLNSLKPKHLLFDITNIYRAYRTCRKRKRDTCNALLFEQNLEENLLDLFDRLNRGVYAPARSQAFIVKKPKMREIFAADFKDRVVHHLLVSHLEPSWERRFIFDSYTCRKHKGIHRAVKRLESFMRKVTTNAVRQAWYLQLDIRGFFITLDKHILYERIIKHEHDPVVQWLSKVIIYNDPTQNCRFRESCREDFERLPPHKTLFKAKPFCGLPIGNLTSQFFANVYLDALDQFVKHVLKARFYVRYCDDMLLVSQSRNELESWEEKIELFLKNQLHLELNERRKLRPVSDGADFLGYIVRPDYLLVRRRVVGAMKDCLKEKEEILLKSGMKKYPNGYALFPWPVQVVEKIHASLSSYLGHLQWASSYRLQLRIWQKYPWLRHYFFKSKGKIVLRRTLPRYAVRFDQQKKWFMKQFRGDILIIQRGRVWEVMNSGKAPVFSCRDIYRIIAALLKEGLSAAWVIETGVRTGNIAERALLCRSLLISETITKRYPERINEMAIRQSDKQVNFVIKNFDAFLRVSSCSSW